MPSSIPYDPGLVLGQVIDTRRINDLKEKARIIKVKDDAENELQQAILARQGLDMIRKELSSLGVSAEKLKEISDKMETMDQTVVLKANAFADASISAVEHLSAASSTENQTQITEEPESPIDFTSSAIVQRMLGSDSMGMNVQYVRNEETKGDEGAHARDVAARVHASLGGFFSAGPTTTVASQTRAATHHQTTNHATTGTVIITVNCTHKRTDIFAPLNLDPDKTVHAWNTLNPDDTINISSAEDVYKLSTESVDASNVMSILTGRSSGSSFVGLVHIVQTEKNDDTQDTSSVMAQVSAEIRGNIMLNGLGGGFGADVSDSLRSMMSSSGLESFCNIVCLGCIPSIAANDVDTLVRELKPVPAEVMEQLAAIRGGSGGDSEDPNSTSASTEQARDGASFMQLNNAFVTNCISQTSKECTAKNKVINMDSMMTCLGDFIRKADEGQGGVPINFYVKDITKKQVAIEVIRKYYQMGNNDPVNTAQPDSATDASATDPNAAPAPA